jgi:fructokinase
VKQPSVACVGELLWDVLPDRQTLGGAPANVAYHLHRLGVDVRVITRIGRDALGTAAREEFERQSLNLAGLQVDEILPTGAAHVCLDERGNADYQFVTPAAWDAIQYREEDRRPVVVFGTLGQRDPRSRTTIDRLTEGAEGILDLNLRPPYVDLPTIVGALERARFVKCNEDEMQFLARAIGLSIDPVNFASALEGRFGVRTVCITRGGRGAQLVDAGILYEATPLPVEIVDTIGAGDAFLAALLVGKLQRAPWSAALAMATRLGAMVAGAAGARPKYDGAIFGRDLSQEPV